MRAEIFGVPAPRQTSIQQPVAGYAMRRAGIQSAPSRVDVKCDGNATHETCGRGLVDAYGSRVVSWPDAAPLTRSRVEVAQFLVEELEQNRYVRESVFIGHE